MSAKLANLGLLKIKLFWNKGYDALNFFHNANRKILSPDSSYIVDLVIWPTFYNSSISMREVILTPFYKDLNRKASFFWGVLLVFKGCLEILQQYEKLIKTKHQKVFRLFLSFTEVTGEKLIWCVFLTPLPHILLQL